MSDDKTKHEGHVRKLTPEEERKARRDGLDTQDPPPPPPPPGDESGANEDEGGAGHDPE